LDNRSASGVAIAIVVAFISAQPRQFSMIERGIVRLPQRGSNASSLSGIAGRTCYDTALYGTQGRMEDGHSPTT